LFLTSAEEIPMRRLKLGEPLYPGVAGFEEGVHYNYTPGGHMLTLSVRNPSASEVDAIRAGQWEFALSATDEAILVLARFDDQPWRIADYNWWINPPVMRPDPPADLARLNGGLPLSVCLVDAANAIVQALRLVRLSPEFASLLFEKVELQTRRAFDPCRYMEAVLKIRTGFRDGGGTVPGILCVCHAGWESEHPPSSSIPHVLQ
jgi:hypothetical protein